MALPYMDYAKANLEPEKDPIASLKSVVKCEPDVTCQITSL